MENLEQNNDKIEPDNTRILHEIITITKGKLEDIDLDFIEDDDLKNDLKRT